MKALVYQGTGKISLEDRPTPEIVEATDAVVKVTRTSICGTDLHIIKTGLPSCAAGRILGHEGVIVETVGTSVKAFKPGDHVLISCITSCANCPACRKLMYSQCAKGGWLLGNAIDGTQAEFVRIPLADTSLHCLRADVDEESVVMLSDMLPTGFECGVLNGKVQPGSTVAIVGAGPVGLAALITSLFYSPGKIIVIDRDANRLESAKLFGATAVVNSTTDKTKETVMALTENRGVDTAMEAVGLPETFEICQQIIAPGGTIANIGVHGKKVDLHLDYLWARNITVTTRLVDTVSTPMLLDVLYAKKINPKVLVTHRFKLDKAVAAYETFADASKTRALKVIIET